MNKYALFLVNSFFWMFAIISAWWNVFNRQAEAYFLVPCLFITTLVWTLFVPVKLLIGEYIGEYRQHSVGYVDARGFPSWEQTMREHRWAVWYETDGFFTSDPNKHVRTKVIICGNCHQWRRVWTGANMENVRYGCPKIPWTYRSGQVAGVPPWSVNERPPWIKTVVRR